MPADVNSPMYPNNNVLVTGALTTTAVTADQVILTYTVTTGKTLFLAYLEANVKLSAIAATSTNFGPLSIRQNGVKKLTFQMAGPGTLNTPVYIELPEPLPFQAGDVISVVCTPSAVTSFDWEANLAGWER